MTSFFAAIKSAWEAIPPKGKYVAILFAACGLSFIAGCFHGKG